MTGEESPEESEPWWRRCGTLSRPASREEKMNRKKSGVNFGVEVRYQRWEGRRLGKISRRWIDGRGWEVSEIDKGPGMGFFFGQKANRTNSE